MATAEHRLTELEIKITYQDDLIKTLNDVIVELRGELKHLNMRVGALEEGEKDAGSERAANEPPPHY